MDEYNTRSWTRRACNPLTHLIIVLYYFYAIGSNYLQRMGFAMSGISRKFFGSIALAGLWLVLSTPASAQVNWTWTNQYGSTLNITAFDQNTGAISGTYTNQAANSCDDGKPQATTGWLVQGGGGTAISFSVNFLGCGSTT